MTAPHLTPEQLADLERLAQAASSEEWQSGKWEHASHSELLAYLSVAIRGRESTDLHGVWIAKEEGNRFTAITGNGPTSEANAAYIAAANPATVLQLIGQVRAAEAVDDGNIFLFCDYVAEYGGCIRGCGHNGPHVFAQRNFTILAPVVLAAPPPARLEGPFV